MVLIVYLSLYHTDAIQAKATPPENTSGVSKLENISVASGKGGVGKSITSIIPLLH